MNRKINSEINIKGAKENNLKDITISIPHNKLIVVTGISGSGKSSLIFDVLAKEGQRRYFETLPSFARQFSGKLNRPDADSIEGLSPVITIGQQTAGVNGRSTVGTITDLYDLLRLLYARKGNTTREIELSRSLFSFNSENGKCKRCNGIGNEEQIDLNKLIRFPEKSIRDGALAPTLPTGYIMYSQVTIDVLNQVCEAEGFNVDIPWNDLTEAQKEIVLFGSDKIKVPFGKHSLESRLKWTGIKAKPREKGFYKGMIPIMSDILRRDRNVNILKYVHAVQCAECEGARLNIDALSVLVHEQRIIDLTTLEINDLNSWIKKNDWDEVGDVIVKKISKQLALLEDIGLGHLQLNRSANTLSASEIQRIRVANQILVPLCDVLYVFDEPSIGLHPAENRKMISYFKELVNLGNTVIIVEHDLETISNAEHIIDIGPLAGELGGEVLYNGPFSSFRENKKLKGLSPTFDALNHQYEITSKKHFLKGETLGLKSCTKNNLKSIDVDFMLGGLNIISGKSGSGKSSLVKSTLLNVVKEQLGEEVKELGNVASVENIELIDKLIYIDHSPIGRTPRSNPATYLGISDYIRDAFSKLEKSKKSGFSKSTFSFNNKGGRCETCQGGGKTQIGMHFLGNVDLTCSSCDGKRFKENVLSVKLSGLSIADVYQLTVSEAIVFFEGYPKIQTGLRVLEEIGLGYLRIGQSSTTLSGGEAQRIKIANQLQRKDTGKTLYVLIEPCIGLHPSNIASLLKMLDHLKSKGNTIVCIEQNPAIIQASDWHIELGPSGGRTGGKLIHHGTPYRGKSITETLVNQKNNAITGNNWIELNGVNTHGLKNINVRFPKNELTVVTGISGSGKSTLVYDTLFSEANTRFTESLSAYSRSFMQQNNEAKIKSSIGLGPAIGLNRKKGTFSVRSTVGSITGLYDSLRLLYSRISQEQGEVFTAQHFSFNHHLGACEVCKGAGSLLECDVNQIIIDESLSVLNGALSSEKAAKYFTNLDGQFIAILMEVAHSKGWELNIPWKNLSDEVKNVILYGTGDKEWEVEWEFKTKSRSGVQQLKSTWQGFCNYIDEELERKQNNKNITELMTLMHEVECYSCKGSRLKPELLATHFLNRNIHEFSQLSLVEVSDVLVEIGLINSATVQSIAEHIKPSLQSTLKTLINLGLGYLSINRSIKTLSGGEQQRVALAGQLSNHLFGVTYVLDEPTIGLDPDQIQNLAHILKALISNGNTVIVVEHDATFIEQADYLIEMGPLSGKDGGNIVYQGELKGIDKFPETATYQLLNYMPGKIPKRRNSVGEIFGVKNASINNLKGFDITFKPKSITAITGVSGSGKSSLIRDVLYGSWKSKKAVGCQSIFGLDQFEDLIYINQDALWTNISITPASYVGILDHLKTIFGSTEKAKELGLKKGDFSYQSKQGKCSVCSGHGKTKTSMDFMSDVWLPCYSCKEQRFNNNILKVKSNGVSIGDVMGMTINHTLNFFDSLKLNKDLQLLSDLGIGHLKLGQASSALSGGEAQRLKLTRELLQKRNGNCLYIFDEPSTGLHQLDIQKLIQVFDGMIADGDTILFIEHNIKLLSCADDLVTLGPGSGVEGGNVL